MMSEQLELSQSSTSVGPVMEDEGGVFTAPVGSDPGSGSDSGHDFGRGAAGG